MAFRLFTVVVIASLMACGAESSDSSAITQYQHQSCDAGTECEDTADTSHARNLGDQDLGGPDEYAQTTPQPRGLGDQGLGGPTENEQTGTPQARGLGDQGEFGGPTEDESGPTPDARGLGDQADLGNTDQPNPPPPPRGLGDQGNLSGPSGGGSFGGGGGGGSTACDFREDGSQPLCLWVNVSAGGDACTQARSTVEAKAECPPGAFGRCVQTFEEAPGVQYASYFYPEEFPSAEGQQAAIDACQRDGMGTWEPL